MRIFSVVFTIIIISFLFGSILNKIDTIEMLEHKLENVWLMMLIEYLKEKNHIKDLLMMIDGLDLNQSRCLEYIVDIMV